MPVAGYTNKVRMLARQCAQNFPTRAFPAQGDIELARASFPLDIADAPLYLPTSRGIPVPIN
jgi:hypothetical protein